MLLVGMPAMPTSGWRASIYSGILGAFVPARDRKELGAMAEFAAVSELDDLGEGEMRAFDVHGSSVAVANVGGVFHAFDDTCTHMGCSLAEGDLEETTVICPCHGSEFDVRSGEVLQGPAREPIATYETRVQGSTLEVAG